MSDAYVRLLERYAALLREKREEKETKRLVVLIAIALKNAHASKRFPGSYLVKLSGAPRGYVVARF